MLLNTNLVLLLIITAIQSVIGWGHEGHREVSRIAYRKTTNRGRKFLKAHGFDSIESFMVGNLWADTRPALEEYPGSEDLHFSHTPWRNCQPFVFKRDCGHNGSGACIVSGIVNMVKRAISSANDVKIRTDAIKFLSHFMADIHQPLHTGFAEDNGGVQIDVEIEPSDSTTVDSRQVSLHQLWDYELLDSTGVATVIASLPSSRAGEPVIPVPEASELEKKILSYASALASESSQLFTCRFGYQSDDGSYIIDHVSKEYLTSRALVAAERLRTAGRRLAELLDVMAMAIALPHAAVAAAGGAAVDHSPLPIVSENYFAVLNFDFDPNELLANITRGGAEDHNFTNVDSVPRAPSNASTQVCGRDVSEYALVKVLGRFVITCRSFLMSNSNYEPLRLFVIKVKFGGRPGDVRRLSPNIPIVFLLDGECFNRLEHPDLSVEDFVRIILHLRGEGIAGDHEDVSRFIEDRGTVAGASGPSLSKVRIQGVVPNAIAPMRVEKNIGSKKTIVPRVPYAEDPGTKKLNVLMARHRLQQEEQAAEVASGRYASLEEKWATEVRLAMHRIIVVRKGNIQMYLHRDTILDKRNPNMKFALHDAIDPTTDSPFKMLIDTRIYDGLHTLEVSRLLRQINFQDRDEMHGFAMQRITLFDELEDLDRVFNGKSADRFDNSQIGIIEEMYIYEGLDKDDERSSTHAYHILEYTLSKLYMEGKYLPKNIRNLLRSLLA